MGTTDKNLLAKSSTKKIPREHFLTKSGTERFRENIKTIRRQHICLREQALLPVSALAKAVIVEEAELVITRNEVADAEGEIQRFKGALEKTIAATQKMADDLASRVGEKEAEIMQGHMMLYQIPCLQGRLKTALKNDKVNSEFAIENVCNMYADMFASMGDELMQQRATDMRDIKVRMQRTLMGLESVDVSLLPKGSILVAKDLTPSMTAGINRKMFPVS